MTDVVKNMLSKNETVDELMVVLDLDYDRLMSLLNSQNRYIYQVNE